MNDEWILESYPKGDPFRACWEFVLTHELSWSERAAFWRGVNLARGVA